MYELSDSTLKQLSKTHEYAFSSEKMAAFACGITGVTAIAISKIYISVGYTALDGALSNSVPYTQLSESYLLGACLYMPLWYAAVSTLFISAIDRMALPKYSDHVKNSQNENKQTIIRRAFWNICVIPDKLGLNSWVGLIVSPSLTMIDGAVATSLGAKLKGVDNQTAADMAILVAASTYIGETVLTPLSLAIRYCLTGNKPTFFPVIKAHDEVVYINREPDQNTANKNDSVHEDETILGAPSRRSTEQGTFMWENAKRNRSPLVAVVEQHNASIDTRTDSPGLRKRG